MLALHGVTVLVTRPEQQAPPLCRLLESRGARVLRLPALQIKPVGDWQFSAALPPIENIDLLIFTSSNAVEFGASLFGRGCEREIAAIGPATARALAHAGFPATVMPTTGFSSEDLLSDARLGNMGGRRVLIVKGRGGRELLQEQLAARGARVILAEVYERVCATRNPEDLAALRANFAAGGIHVITATSVETAECLLESAAADLRREFDRVHWLVPSLRVAAAVRERGVTAPILRADSAEDQDLVAAIERWRSSVSGA